MKKSSSKSYSSQYFSTDHLKTDLKGRSVRGGTITMAAQACKFGLSIGSNIFLARLLTPNDYGLIGMVTAVVGLVALFKDMGLSMATVQKAEITHSQVSTLFWINVLVSGAIMLLTAALAPIIAWFYGEPRLVWITVALSSAFIFGGITVQHQALLNRQMQFAALSIIDIVSIAVGIVAAIVSALWGAGYWALVIMQIATPLVNAIGVWVMCSWRPGPPAWDAEVRTMLAFGRNLTGFSIINYFGRNLDNVLIGKYWGAEQLGLYAKAYQLLLLPLNQINAPIGAVAVPTLSRLADSPERYKQAYLQILEKLSILTMPLIAFMIATSDWIVTLLLGPQWSGASTIFSLLGIVGLTQPVSNTVGWLFITQGRTNEMLKSGLVGGVLAVVSILVGLPWGAVGVAASYSISGLLIRTPLLFWFAGRAGSVRATDLYKAMLTPAYLSSGILISLLLFRWQVPVGGALTGTCAASMITTVIVLFFLMFTSKGKQVYQDFKSIIVSLLLKQKKQI